MRYSLFALLIIWLLAACEKILPKPLDDSSILDGPVEGLNESENRQFLAGDAAFNDDVFTANNGLGPIFISTSCGSCHAGDGKGHPMNALVRFGQSDDSGNQFLHLGGPQLQHLALPGYLPEHLPPGAPFTKLLPPANTGLGLLEFVPDSEIMAMSDPEDTDGDGISGRPNWITLPGYVIPKANAITENGQYIGRFGKKAAVYDLLQQTARAYNQDMGINSTFEPIDTYSGSISDPEISNLSIHNVVFYLRALKAPIQRDADAPAVMAGKTIFEQIGCQKCHSPKLHTGSSSIVPLNDRDFYPYTDMLLHDMGAQLDDGYTEGGAQTFEWRTPPLWGLGLSKNSQGGQYYLLHDGRAQSIEDAILLHGGEGNQSREAYKGLNEVQKAQLINFLESL